MTLIGRIIGYTPKVFNYTKRLVKASPYIMFGDAANAGAKAASAVTKTADISVGQYIKNMIKAGGKGIEANVEAAKAATGSGFFKSMWKSIKEIPSVLGASRRMGAGRAMVTAKAAGKSGLALKLAGFNGGIKGFCKGIGKKLPLIGNLFLIALELPNIIKATKEKGIGQGLIETVRAAARLTGASLAAAVGTTIAGPLGGFIGFAVGDWLTTKIVGKSYSEKKALEQEKDAEALERVQRMQQEGTLPASAAAPQAVQQPSFTGNPFNNGYQSNPFNNDNFSNPYADDIYMQNMNFNAIA